MGVEQWKDETSINPAGTWWEEPGGRTRRSDHVVCDLPIWSHHFVGNRWGNSGNSDRLYFLGAPKSLQMVIAAMKLKDVYYLEEKL